MTSSSDAFVPFGRDAWPALAAAAAPPAAAVARPVAPAALAPAPPGLATTRAEPASGWALPDFLARDPGAGRTPEDEAFALGLAEGMRQGVARTRAEIASALQALAGVTERVDLQRTHFERDRELNLGSVALAVARQIVQREVATDPGIVRDLVAHALSLMPPDPPLEIRLHPADLAAIHPELEALLAGGRGGAQWTPDAALDRGSFTIEGPARIVDGRVDVALRALFERIAHA